MSDNDKVVPFTLQTPMTDFSKLRAEDALKRQDGVKPIVDALAADLVAAGESEYGRGYPTADCDPNSPLPISGNDVASPEFAQLDIEALFNMRGWVEDALKAKGAKVIGAGIGCGGTMGIADIQIEVDGCPCNIEIRPLAR